MNNTCFVAMPIGTQTYGDTTVSESQLRDLYDNVIRAAIEKADPSLQVTRSDDGLNPGSVSNDIFTNLMNSKFVVVDITYPNPNVFYELGIRHAIQPGAILIREKGAINAPFDISHLRYIEYENSTAGINRLADKLRQRFEYYKTHPTNPDNQFQDLCQYTDYTPTTFGKNTYTTSKLINTLLDAAISSPEMLQALIPEGTSEYDKKIWSGLLANPKSTKKLLSTMAEAGMIDIN